MMASPNDYMYIIFPCLTTYLMQVLKMFLFFLCNKKKAISQKAFSRKHKAKIIQQKTAKKHSQKSIQHTAEKHFPEKLIFWITSPWQVCFKKVVSVSDKERFQKCRKGFLNFLERFWNFGKGFISEKSGKGFKYLGKVSDDNFKVGKEF